MIFLLQGYYNLNISYVFNYILNNRIVEYTDRSVTYKLLHLLLAHSYRKSCIEN